MAVAFGVDAAESSDESSICSEAEGERAETPLSRIYP